MTRSTAGAAGMLRLASARQTWPPALGRADHALLLEWLCGVYRDARALGEPRVLDEAALTTLEEGDIRASRVFLVATANDIARLPPELLRKGRFDELFFVDLPDAATREAILAIHLQRRGLAPERFDLPALAALSEQCSGAELEQAIVASHYGARARDAELDQDALAAELMRATPLATLMAERIQGLRDWARERGVQPA